MSPLVVEFGTAPIDIKRRAESRTRTAKKLNKEHHVNPGNKRVETAGIGEQTCLASPWYAYGISSANNAMVVCIFVRIFDNE